MDYIKDKLGIVFLVSALLLGLSACTGDEDFDYPFIGGWGLVESAGVPVHEYDAVYFDFFGDGEGNYQYYDFDYNEWVTEPFYWEVVDVNRIHIIYHNHYLGDTYCYYHYDGAYLYLSDYPDFYLSDVYAPSNY